MKSEIFSACLAIEPTHLSLSGHQSAHLLCPSHHDINLPPEAWQNFPLFAERFGILLASWQQQHGGQPLHEVEPYFNGEWLKTVSQSSRLEPPPANVPPETFISLWQQAARHSPAGYTLLKELPGDCYEDQKWRPLHPSDPIQAKTQLRLVRHRLFVASEPWQMIQQACALHGLSVQRPRVASFVMAQALSADGNEPVGLLDLGETYASLVLVREQKMWRFHTLDAQTDSLPASVLREVIDIWVHLPEQLQDDVHLHILDPHHRLPPTLSEMATDMGISLLTGGDAKIARNRAWQAACSGCTLPEPKQCRSLI